MNISNMNQSIGNIIDAILTSTDQGKIQRLSMQLSSLLQGQVQPQSYNGGMSILVQPYDGSPQYRITSSDQFIFPQQQTLAAKVQGSYTIPSTPTTNVGAKHYRWVQKK